MIKVAMAIATVAIVLTVGFSLYQERNAPPIPQIVLDPVVDEYDIMPVQRLVPRKGMVAELGKTAIVTVDGYQCRVLRTGHVRVIGVVGNEVQVGYVAPLRLPEEALEYTSNVAECAYDAEFVMDAPVFPDPDRIARRLP